MRWMNKLTPQTGEAGAGSQKCVWKETTCQSKKGTDLEIIEKLRRIRSSM